MDLVNAHGAPVPRAPIPTGRQKGTQSSAILLVDTRTPQAAGRLPPILQP